MGNRLHLGMALWLRFRRSRRNKFVTYTPPDLRQAALTKAGPVFELPMGRISTSVTFVIHKETRSRCSQATRVNLAATDNATISAREDRSIKKCGPFRAFRGIIDERLLQETAPGSKTLVFETGATLTALTPNRCRPPKPALPPIAYKARGRGRLRGGGGNGCRRIPSPR